MTATTQPGEIGTQDKGVASVLALGPSLSDQADEVCTDLLSTGNGDRNVLWVSYAKPPDTQVRRWRASGEDTPAEVGVIGVDETSRSAAATAGSVDGGMPTRPTSTVTNPTDLTGVGIAITEQLKEWDENENQTVVCFDSLTALLQYVDLETAYEFLHVILGRLQAVGAVAHFHIDPSAHDEQTIETVKSLFDATVEFDGDSRTVQTRN